MFPQVIAGKHGTGFWEYENVTDRALWGRTAIVGVGDSDYGALYRSEPRHPIDLAIDAVHDAIVDAGIEKDDVDGLIVGGLPRYDPFMLWAGMQMSVSWRTIRWRVGCARRRSRRRPSQCTTGWRIT